MSEVRERTLEELGLGVFDLLVVGGGIVGGRVAFDAARAGLRVALVDAGDFGGATSGASARLVHGGLRYLRTGNVRLVRTALRERNILASRIAPHLVRPLPFVLSAAEGQRSKCAAGLIAYAALNGFSKPLPRFVTAEEAVHLVPSLRVDGIASHTVFQEAETNDSRLALANVTAAARSGAVVANYLRAVALELAPGNNSRVLLRGREGTITARCRAVVNATGPWVDLVREMEDPGCGPIACLSKGIHVVLRPAEKWRAAVAVSMDGGSHLYAVPCEDMILLGTTDEEYLGDPAGVAAEPADVISLLDMAHHFLRPEILGGERVISAFAGLRVLPRGEVASRYASRDHLLSIGPGGMVSVAGGKLTTQRQISLDALRRLPSGVRPRTLSLSDAPLPGAYPICPPDSYSRLDAPNMDHLLHLYGAESARLLEYSTEHHDALEQITPGAPDLWAQAYHAISEEWAVKVEDIIYRRTSLGLRGFDTPEIRQRISRLLEDEITTPQTTTPPASPHTFQVSPRCSNLPRVYR